MGKVPGTSVEDALMTVCVSSVPSNHSRIFGTSNRAAFSPAHTRSEHLLKASYGYNATSGSMSTSVLACQKVLTFACAIEKHCPITSRKCFGPPLCTQCEPK